MMTLFSAIYCLFVALCLSIPSHGFRLHGASMIRRSIPSKTALPATTADFKNGMTFEVDGTPVRLVEFLHVKPGKGSAFVRTKIKNLTNGNVIEKTFRAGESIQLADVSRVPMQFTYADGDMLCFMNSETYEEERAAASIVPNADLLMPGLSCNVVLYNGRVIEVALPAQQVYTVASLDGAGSSNVATLESGASVTVPLFVEVGQKILVSTDDCKYLSKALRGADM